MRWEVKTEVQLGSAGVVGVVPSEVKGELLRREELRRAGTPFLTSHGRYCQVLEASPALNVDREASSLLRGANPDAGIISQ